MNEWITSIQLPGLMRMRHHQEHHQGHQAHTVHHIQQMHHHQAAQGSPMVSAAPSARPSPSSCSVLPGCSTGALPRHTSPWYTTNACDSARVVSQRPSEP